MKCMCAHVLSMCVCVCVHVCPCVYYIQGFEPANENCALKVDDARVTVI